MHVGKKALAALALCAVAANAQWTYPGCANVTNSDPNFVINNLVTPTNDPSIVEPVKMAFDMTANGNVDIYFIQRLGQLKWYNGTTRTVTLLGNVFTQPGNTTQTGNEDGLVGIALDPNFKTNFQVFLYYSHTTSFRLSRFTLNATTRAIVSGSETIYLNIPSDRGKWHTSGGMNFDAYGDLWMNIGDNETLRDGPANTNDLRGSVLRIHPNANGTYSIPAGNMWETTATYFQNQGRNALAAQYRDPAQMRREIYLKGIRNTYIQNLDPVRRWVLGGDCGPDQEPGGTTNQALWTEEHTVMLQPGFLGWPFWSANQHVQVVKPYSGAVDPFNWTTTMSPNVPVNTYAPAAIDTLPPAVAGTRNYAHSCAMTGPLYRYDGDLANNYKLPPHFNRVWFMSDFNQQTIFAVRMNDNGTMNGTPVTVFTNLRNHASRGTPLNSPLDFKQGPDGALYALNYSCGTWRTQEPCTGISRIEYTGTCQDPNLKLEVPVSLHGNARRNADQMLRVDYQSVSVLVPGEHDIQILDVQGRVILGFSGTGEKTYSLPPTKGTGVYQVRLKTAKGVLAVKSLMRM